MANDLTKVTREIWAQALEEQREVDIPSVVRTVMDTYPDLVAQESERLICQALRRELNELARKETEDGCQLELFGFPSVIAVPQEGDGYHYMQTTKARWEELLSGKQVREDNVRRALLKLDTYRNALDHVRPVMESTQLTFAEAYRKPLPE